VSHLVVPARLIAVHTTIPSFVDLAVHPEWGRRREPFTIRMSAYSTADVIRRLTLVHARAANPHGFEPLHLDPTSAPPYERPPRL
jgi:hypothetical protein